VGTGKSKKKTVGGVKSVFSESRTGFNGGETGGEERKRRGPVPFEGGEKPGVERAVIKGLEGA